MHTHAVADVVVISTHLDDAVLSCYGALSPETLVVTVLAGVPPRGVLGGWDAAGGATDSHDRVLERRREDGNALLLTGAQPLHLDFAEAQHGTAPTREELAAGLAKHLGAAHTVYAPAGIHNTEHKTVRDAVLALQPNAVLYADLPYARHPTMGGFNLPAEVSETGRQRREVHLDSQRVALKLESSRCYASQLRQLLEIFGPFLTLNALGTEVYWHCATPVPNS